MPKKKLISETQLLILLNQKVDKVEGKDLSTHDFNDAARDLLHTLSNELNNKVDKVEGKGLSTCDFSNAYKNKLDGIENGAQENLIEEIRVFNIPLTITGKAVNLDLSAYYYSKTETDQLLNGKEDKSNKVTSISSQSTDSEYPSAKATYDAIKRELSNVYRFQGSKTVAELNAMDKTASMHGYVYNVTNDGTLNYQTEQGGGISTIQVIAGDNVALVWKSDTNGYAWDKLAGTFTVDLSNYYTKAQADAKFGKLQDYNEWSGTNRFNGAVRFYSSVSLLGNNSSLLLRSGKTILSNGMELVKVGSSHYDLPYSNNVETFYTLATTNMLSDYVNLSNLFKTYNPRTRYFEGDVIYDGSGFYRAIHDIPNPPDEIDFDDWEYLGDLQDVVMDHEERITALEEASPSGNTLPIDVKIVEMKILQDDVEMNDRIQSEHPELTYTFSQCERDFVWCESGGDTLLNDPRFAYLHIKSSFLDQYALDKIEAGLFMLRWDYPITMRSHRLSRDKRGRGHYSYTRSLYKEDDVPITSYTIRKNGIIQIRSDDVMTDEIGRKFIYKKIQFGVLVNILWPTGDDTEFGHWNDNFFDAEDVNGNLLRDSFDWLRVGGAVQTHPNSLVHGEGQLNQVRQRDSGINDKYATGLTEQEDTDQRLFPQSNKDLLTNHYWAVMINDLNGDDVGSPFQSRSNANIDFSPKLPKLLNECVVKPRLCVMKNGWDTTDFSSDGGMFETKYSQYPKRLYLYPGEIWYNEFEIDDGEFGTVAVFRLGISK